MNFRQFLNSMVILLLGIFIGVNIKYFYSKEVKIVKKVNHETKHKIRPSLLTYDEAIGCVKSQIKIHTQVKHNVVFIKAEDSCKYAKSELFIATNGNFKLYAGITVGVLAVGILYKYMQ